MTLPEPGGNVAAVVSRAPEVCPDCQATRNRVLTYVYNLFGERETIVPGRKPDAPQRSEGIVLKAAPADPRPPEARADHGQIAHALVLCMDNDLKILDGMAALLSRGGKGLLLCC